MLLSRAVVRCAGADPDDPAEEACAEVAALLFWALPTDLDLGG